MARSVISGVDVNGRSCYSVSVAAGTQPHSRGSRADSKVKNELDRLLSWRAWLLPVRSQVFPGIGSTGSVGDRQYFSVVFL